MKKLLFTTIVVLSLSLSSCDSSNSKSSKSSESSEKCSDMSSYNTGKQAGVNDKVGGQITGERYPCYKVYDSMYSSYNKECFCKGYSVGSN